MLTSDEAWGEVQREFARIDAAPGPRRRRRRKTAEEEADEFVRVPDPPELSFEWSSPPPRWTVQAGRGCRIVKGRPTFFLKAKARAAADKMTAMFREALPAGWEARGGPVRVEVQLVFPLHRDERVAAPQELIPDTSHIDLDNVSKGLFDFGLVRGGVIRDDSQIADYHVTKHRGLCPRWSVRLWWLGDGAQGQFDF